MLRFGAPAPSRIVLRNLCKSACIAQVSLHDSRVRAHCKASKTIVEPSSRISFQCTRWPNLLSTEELNP